MSNMAPDRWLAALVCVLIVAVQSDAALPDAATGGPDGGPAAILVCGHVHGIGRTLIDEKYQQELTDTGYRVVATDLANRLSAEYLQQFGVIVLNRLPDPGTKYRVFGHKLLHYDRNIELIHDYVAAGGGLIVQPAFSESGETYNIAYSKFLKRYDARFLVHQLRDDTTTRGAYAVGVISGKHELARGLKHLLYPINVLRWDLACSTTPILVGSDWTVLAAGGPGAGSHQPIDNRRVGPRLSAHRNLFAVRRYGKGYVALSGIHAFYTSAAAYWDSPAMGENNTGLIAGAVLHGRKGGRKSDLGVLLDRTYRHFAANSAKHGLGGGEVGLPEQDPDPVGRRALDWHAQRPPPTWRHRIIPATLGDARLWDERPDPLVAGEIKHLKVLVGPRTALSSGRGTVKEYRDAAIEAGYCAIAFAETFEHTTPKTWQYLLQACDDNSDDRFVCLPGMDIQGFQGERYLVLGTRRYPDPEWLTDDGKRLQAIRMLSLGAYGRVSLVTVHRPGRSPLHPKMYKHYAAISVYTYDGQGTLIDEGLHAYQWAVRSDSNPVPLTVHELTGPEQVPAARAGFQQIMPAASVREGARYFRFGLAHYFDSPLRYYISEGPILDGWSIVNKDIGPAEWNRDHWRLGVGVRSDKPIDEVTLYDGFEIAGRWRPRKEEFRTTVDGFHDAQHHYLLVARDADGRRVLSPGIRTVTRNWRLRCGDRQNWLGSAMFIYTGCKFANVPSYSMPLHGTREGVIQWHDKLIGGNPCPVFDYPFFSNHVQISDVDLSAKYIAATNVGYDARPTYAVRPTDVVDGYLRSVYFTPLKREDFAAALVQVDLKLKRDAQPVVNSPVWPSIAGVNPGSNVLILPGKEPGKLAHLTAPQGRRSREKGDPANMTVELPVGSYVAGLIPLTEGLRLHGRRIGFPAPQGAAVNLHAGDTWHAEYLVLKRRRFWWRRWNTGWDVDRHARQALTQMGFAGPTPYKLELTQGRLDRVAYFADLTAARGGVAGTCRNDKGEELLFDVPLRIAGLNPRCAAALWRSDTERLDYFDCFKNVGHVPLNADKTVDFYAGNVATCDPALFVSVVIWDPGEAWFRVNNPTNRDITTEFATVEPIKGWARLRKTITVKAGTSLDIKG